MDHWNTACTVSVSIHVGGIAVTSEKPGTLNAAECYTASTSPDEIDASEEVAVRLGDELKCDIYPATVELMDLVKRHEALFSNHGQ